MAMTLQEMLDLLPDNTTGAIDASDLRTIVTDLCQRVEALESTASLDGNQIGSIGEQVVSNTARITALEAADGGGGGVSVTGRWQVNPTGGSVPGGKQVTASSGEWQLATWLRFDPTDLNNNDLRNALTVATQLLGQQQSDAGNWARWDVTGPVTDTGQYIEVPVSYVDGDGGIAAAQWQESVWVIYRSAA